jgi:anti-sigma B factor antagonist
MLSFASRENLNSRLVELSSALLGRARTKARQVAPVSASRPVATSGTGLTCSRADSPTECVLRLGGALDFQSAPELRAVFDELVASALPLVTLDLEGLKTIDSSGVGAIVSLFKRVKAGGGTLVVKNVKGQPLQICKLLKLERVFGL